MGLQDWLSHPYYQIRCFSSLTLRRLWRGVSGRRGGGAIRCVAMKGGQSETVFQHKQLTHLELSWNGVLGLPSTVKSVPFRHSYFNKHVLTGLPSLRSYFQSYSVFVFFSTSSCALPFISRFATFLENRTFIDRILVQIFQRPLPKSFLKCCFIIWSQTFQFSCFDVEIT